MKKLFLLFLVLVVNILVACSITKPKDNPEQTVKTWQDNIYNSFKNTILIEEENLKYKMVFDYDIYTMLGTGKILVISTGVFLKDYAKIGLKRNIQLDMIAIKEKMINNLDFEKIIYKSHSYIKINKFKTDEYAKNINKDFLNKWLEIEYTKEKSTEDSLYLLINNLKSDNLLKIRKKIKYQKYQVSLNKEAITKNIAKNSKTYINLKKVDIDAILEISDNKKNFNLSGYLIYNNSKKPFYINFENNNFKFNYDNLININLKTNGNTFSGNMTISRQLILKDFTKKEKEDKYLYVFLNNNLYTINLSGNIEKNKITINHSFRINGILFKGKLLAEKLGKVGKNFKKFIPKNTIKIKKDQINNLLF